MSLFFQWMRRRSGAVPAHRYRPAVESLESRTLLTAYTVTTTNDLLNDTSVGQVTLRDVITAIDTQAPSGNAAAGTASANTIDFRIGAAASVQTIDLASALPAVKEPVFIDGWSQGGAKYAGTPLIVLNGASAGDANGLEFGAGSDGSTVRGLVIQAFNGNGIVIQAANDIQITANYIGTDAKGTTALGNGADAILIDQGASGNIIGGTARGAGNVICGSVVAPPGGTVGTQTGTFALSPASISGSIASFNVTVNYTDASGYQMVYVGVDLRDSSSTLAPPDPTTGQPDYSAFNFIPSSTLGSNWQAVANAFPGEFLYHTPPSSGGTPSGLAPNASYVIGTITYDLSQFGISPSAGLSLSIAGTDTVIGAEIPGEPASFAFINPNFAVAQQPLVNAAPTTTGVEIAGTGASGNQVVGNVIGAGPGGAKSLGQLSDGVLIDSGATNNTVGGTSAGAANIIAGNDTGIVITDPGTDGNTVLGNRIGTDAHGAADLANTVAGVILENGASANSVGGTAPGSGNAIAFNGKGVVIGSSPGDTATVHDTILGNSIFANVVSPIELGNDGPTANGVNPRAYPNDGQNAPLIAAITPHTVSGSLTSAANTTYRIEFYANSTGTAKPGQTFLGFLDVTTNATGSATFTLPVAALPIGDTVTGTATNLSTGDTSESSPIGTEIVFLGSPVVTSNSMAQTTSLSIEVLTSDGPATSGSIVITIPGLPGKVTVPLSGKAVITIAFPIPANAAPGSYTIDATALDADNVLESSAAGVLTIGAAVSRRWAR